ncbi:MAG: AI-2E family transporter [Nanoarchaeota archaeon]
MEKLITEKYGFYISLGFFFILLLLSFIIIKPLLLAILFGALLAYVSYPVKKAVSEKIKNETISSLVVCFLFFLILIIPAVFLAKALMQESYVLYLLIKQKSAVGLFQSCGNAFCSAVKNFARNEFVHSQVKTVVESATNWIISKGSSFLVSLPRILLNLFIIFFAMFYFLKDGRKLLASIEKYSIINQKKYSYLLTRLKEILHGLIYGYILMAAVQGALGALGFYLFGVSSPLLWGIVMAFLALIPVLGTGLVWVPASAILFLEGLFQDSTMMMLKGAGLFVYSLIFVSSLDNILRPKLMGGKAKVHTGIIMGGLFGGILVLGPLGIIIGPLVLALTIEIINVYLLKEEKREEDG